MVPAGHHRGSPRISGRLAYPGLGLSRVTPNPVVLLVTLAVLLTKRGGCRGPGAAPLWFAGLHLQVRKNRMSHISGGPWDRAPLILPKSTGGVVYWQVRKPALLPDEGPMGNVGYEKKDEKIRLAIRVDEYWYGIRCHDLPCGAGLAPMAGGQPGWQIG